MAAWNKIKNLSARAMTPSSRILAALCLIYFAPVLLAVAVLIKCESRGPVLLKRNRRDVYGHTIATWEFRTDAINHEVQEAPSGDVMPVWALGTFLRESRLYLLPRLFNILRGELPFDAVCVDTTVLVPLMWSMLDRLGYDMSRLEHDEFESKVATMAKRCDSCTNVPTCQRWFDTLGQVNAYREFCPNASAFDSLPRAAASY